MLTNTTTGNVEVPNSDPPQWMHWLRVMLAVGVRPECAESRFDSDDDWVEFEPVATDRWTVSAFSITESSLIAPSVRRRMEQRLNDAVRRTAA